MVNIPRIKNILITPQSEWPVIEQERSSVGQIISGYLIWLLALSALATFIKYAVFGTGFFFNVKVGVFPALVHAVAGIFIGLIVIYLISLLVNALAPSFGGQKNSLSAFKLVAYASTAGLIGSVLNLLPFVGYMLALLAGLYGIFLVFTGLPVLMKSTDKTIAYTIVIAIVGFLISMVIGMLSSALLPDMSKGGSMRIGAGEKSITVDSNAIEKYSSQLEQATKKIGEAADSGNPEAVGKAAAGALAAIFGSSDKADRDPIPTQTLKTHIPETLAGMQRKSFEVESNKVLGFQVTEIEGVYQLEERHLSLNIVDLGAASVISAMAGWALTESEKENDTMSERTYKSGGRMISESAAKDGSRSSVKMLLGNGVALEAKARQIPLSELLEILAQMDLDGLESAR